MGNLLDKIKKSSLKKPASQTDAPKKVENQQLFILSAETETALRERAERYAAFLRDADAAKGSTLADLCFSTALHNAQHAHRLAVVTATKEDLADQLAAFTAGEPKLGTTAGRMRAEQPRLAFVCTGMGPQWWAMGRQLLETEPVFRQTAEEIDALFRPLAGWSILEEMGKAERASRMSDTEVAQAGNFVMQAALAALYKSWGIVPDGLIGHSAGEPSAAYLAGAMSLVDAVKVTHHIGRLQQRTTGQGKLVAVGVEEAVVRERLQGYEDRVSLAAINGPGSLTLVGEPEALQELVRPWEEEGAFVRFLQVNVPYHSHYQNPLQEELIDSLAGLDVKDTEIPLYSPVTGRREAGQVFDAVYWWRNIREPVLFGTAAQELLKDGYDVFLEIGPHPVLNSSIQDLLAGSGKEAAVLASLRRQTDERLTMLGSLGQLYVLGYDVKWSALYPTAREVELPL